MTAPAVVRIPTNPVLPHGAFYFIKGLHPRVRLEAPDGSVIFEILGGGSIADKYESPECVVLKSAPKGMIAGWKFIDQQGANEDGVTFLNAVNDAGEVTLPLRVIARDGAHLRWVMRLLLGSVDKTKKSKLSWFTQELGYWWGDVRHSRPDVNGYRVGGQATSTTLDLHLRIDGGAWRSFDHVDESPRPPFLLDHRPRPRLLEPSQVRALRRGGAAGRGRGGVQRLRRRLHARAAAARRAGRCCSSASATRPPRRGARASSA